MLSQAGTDTIMGQVRGAAGQLQTNYCNGCQAKQSLVPGLSPMKDPQEGYGGSGKAQARQKIPGL